MVTNDGYATYSEAEGGGKVVHSFVNLDGLSTNTKPTTQIANGSTFFELDTGKVYAFDQENTLWREL